MQSLSELMKKATSEMNLDYSYSKDKSTTELLVELDNERTGSLKGFECDKCLNRGFITHYHKETDSSYIVHCECMKVRKAMKNAEMSGMGELLSYKLRDFKAVEPFQIAMRDKVKDYILKADTEWFMALGQSGIGKSMVCASICNQRLKEYRQVKYMIWNEFVDRLKRMKYDLDRDEFFNEYAKAEILYIDDLFKGKVTDSDVNIAFQLINERYNTNSVTIISSELLLNDLRDIDEAIAGRMKEKAKSYCIQVGKDSSKNYRFKDEV
ncbi:MAG: ATP-binding protein, partial [Turicibacter sp.]|nr:ATP-binding protein [Turicibacter sp.]